IGLLSKGFRQRVGLAAAILHDPKVLLLDEPTSGLDPNQAREVRELILRLKSRKTVLFSTHILSEARSLCDRIMIIHKGRIAASGTQEELTRLGGGSSSLSLTLKTGAEGPSEAAVRDALAALGAVSSMETRTEGSELRVRLSVAADTGDIRESIFRCCVGRRWTLLELKREEASLEKLFHELTQ
ncbi:MAG: AAA family ATPase, partial [Elusimicrobiota bacterium]